LLNIGKYENILKKMSKILINCRKREKNKKILKKLKKCVDKLKRLVYNKLTKTNSHR